MHGRVVEQLTFTELLSTLIVPAASLAEGENHLSKIPPGQKCCWIEMARSERNALMFSLLERTGSLFSCYLAT